MNIIEVTLRKNPGHSNVVYVVEILLNYFLWLNDWVKVNFQAIYFDNHDKNEHKPHSINLEKRYSRTKTLKKHQTLALFCFKK